MIRLRLGTIGRAALLAVCLASTAACGNGTPQPAGIRGGSKDTAADRTAQWQAILANPGTSGVDYDPGKITVSYRSGAVLAASQMQVLPPAGKRAADRRNPMLRKDHSYEAITNAIAGGLGIDIDSQVYNPAVHFASFELPAGANGTSVLAAIRTQFAGQIEWATYSRLYKPCFEPNDPDYISSTDTSGPAWQIHKLHCPDAWDITLGSPDVWIAILDTGVNYHHIELTDSVLDPAIYFPAATCDVGENDNEPLDNYGHGSGCAGMAVAANNDGEGNTGVAPGCRVIPIKIDDENTSFEDSYIVEGGYLAQSLGARIISMSFGGYNTMPLIETMCSDLHGQGMLLCASAGNGDTEELVYPASYDGCLSIGATNIDDARISHEGWWGSEYSPPVAISAPGEDYNSCDGFDNAAYQDFGGTSGASPQVAAVAALAWSIHPDWTNDEIRARLIETALPTTGFGHDVPRVDAGNFMATYASGFSLPGVNQLIQRGPVQLSAQPIGNLESLDAYVDGVLAQHLASAPWDIDFAVDQPYFGPVNLRYTGVADGHTSERNYELIADNTVSSYPLYLSCDMANPDLLAIDVKNLNPPAVTQLHQPGGTWSLAGAKSFGTGTWRIATDGAFMGGSYFCGLPGGGYDGYEMDALLTKELDLTTVSNPTLSFVHHYNVEDGGVGFDKCLVMVSADSGLSWEMAALHGGGDASFTGYLPDWTDVQVDLGAYSGEKVHVVFLFESDQSWSGEDQDAPAGWWVDNIQFSSDFLELAHFDSCGIAPYTVAGLARNQPTLTATLVNPQNIGSVSYYLDCAPLGVSGPEDTNVSGPGDVDTVVAIPPAAGNQLANLVVKSFDQGGTPGAVTQIPIYIFNQLGDADADGSVGASDLTAIQGAQGLQAGGAGFSPFLDSDGDGRVTEADAAPVGYFWSGT